jgi:hypothetical protein
MFGKRKDAPAKGKKRGKRLATLTRDELYKFKEQRRIMEDQQKLASMLSRSFTTYWQELNARHGLPEGVVVDLDENTGDVFETQGEAKKVPANG